MTKFVVWLDATIALFNLMGFILTGSISGLISFFVLAFFSYMIYITTYGEEKERKKKKKEQEIKYISKLSLKILKNSKNTIK